MTLIGVQPCTPMTAIIISASILMAHRVLTATLYGTRATTVRKADLTRTCSMANTVLKSYGTNIIRHRKQVLTTALYIAA